MTSFWPAFLFLSPIFGYAIYLLVVEMSDPMGPFHEKYRVRKMREFSQFNTSLTPAILNSKHSFFSQFEKLSRAKIIGVVLISVLIISFFSPFLSLLLVISGLFLFLFIEKRMEARVREAKSLRIAQELPAVTEIFAILISSGESISSALEILSKSVNGEIALILSEAVVLLRRGLSLTATLDNISQKSGVPQLRRFCDSLIVASERGTELSEVLARQIDEIRGKEHGQKLERAGRAEIALMIPVVFLILPISVLFSLWPSYVALGQSATF